MGEDNNIKFKDMFFIQDIIDSIRIVKYRFWTFLLSILFSFIISAIISILIMIGLIEIIPYYIGMPNLITLITNPISLKNQLELFLILGVLVLSFFLTFIAPLFGIASEILEATESYAERIVYYLRRYFVKFFIASLIISILAVFVPILFFNEVQNWLWKMGLYTPYVDEIISELTFITVFFAITGLMFMYPAIIARKSIYNAFKESLGIIRHHYLRIYPTTIIFILIAAIFTIPFSLLRFIAIIGMDMMLFLGAVGVYAFVYLFIAIFLLSAYTVFITKIYWIINSNDVSIDNMYTKGIHLMGD